jgi:hypothetical protein
MMTILALWQAPAEAETVAPSFFAVLLRWNAIEVVAAIAGLGVFLGLASLARRHAPRLELWIVAALLPCWSMTFALGFRALGWDYDNTGFWRAALATLVGATAWAVMRGRTQAQESHALPFPPLAILAVPISSFVLLETQAGWQALSVNWTVVIPPVQLVAIGVAWAVLGSRGASAAPRLDPDPIPPREPEPESEAPRAEPAADSARASHGARLFISYRREDSAYISDRINERLTQRFGRQTVFKDVDSIPLGQDFRKHLREAVGGCDVLLAVIGRDWLSVNPATGARRIDDPRDHLRIEVESALERDIPVIPVLVQGASVPAEAELPESLRPLAYRNAQQVRPDPDFNNDMDRLLRGLEQLLRRS